MTGLAELLKKLTPITSGSNAEDILTADRLNALQEIVRMLARGKNVSASGSVYKKESASGYSLWGKKSVLEDTVTVTYPFGVTPSGDGVIVELDSWLMQNEQWDSKVTITGLGAEIAMATDFKVWLELTLDAAGNITAATIEAGLIGITDQWEFFPDPIGYDDPESASRRQTTYFHLLAYTIDKPDTGDIYTDYNWPVLAFDAGDQYLVSTTRNHLILCPKCSSADGVLVYVTAPWFVPFLEQA